MDAKTVCSIPHPLHGDEVKQQAEGLYRILEVFEHIPSNSARHMLDALSQASAEIGCAAGAVAGAYEPGAEASDLIRCPRSHIGITPVSRTVGMSVRGLR
ncbi:hypothetical protein [Streptomyces bacillaris]|uniref:hypothetical protein n=1 Tax=Streptomyces bacillaris TaxID=68179 RepID=UPI003460A97A